VPPLMDGIRGATTEQVQTGEILEEELGVGLIGGNPLTLDLTFGSDSKLALAFTGTCRSMFGLGGSGRVRII